ncbi:MAG TPA: hypothetical protein VND93_29480 [Myxococcales bacterium]|nr:hypothetical protein [Myxococcales bacterium]
MPFASSFRRRMVGAALAAATAVVALPAQALTLRVDPVEQPDRPCIPPPPDPPDPPSPRPDPEPMPWPPPRPDPHPDPEPRPLPIPDAR